MNKSVRMQEFCKRLVRWVRHRVSFTSFVWLTVHTNVAVISVQVAATARTTTTGVIRRHLMFSQIGCLGLVDMNGSGPVYSGTSGIIV